MLTNLVQYHDPLGLQNGHSPIVIFFIVTWNTTIKKNFLTSNFHLANNAVHIHRQEKSLVLSSYLRFQNNELVPQHPSMVTFFLVSL